MNILKKVLFVTLSFTLLLSLAGCKAEEKIIVAEGDWDSNVFHNQVIKLIIENGYGVDVEIVTADTAIMVSSLKTNDIDIAMELWSENVPTYKDDINNGEYIKLGTNFDDNAQGLYVPTYLIEGEEALAPDLKTVEDLKKYPELFPDPEGSDKGIIYGGPEGWGATEFLHKKMDAYGLSEYYTFKTIDSSSTLNATLKAAYDNKEPWVGYNWEPTWIMGLYDMTLLEDSDYSAKDYENGIGAFSSVNVDIVCNTEFPEKYPEITEFLSKYNSTSELTSAALGVMQENNNDGEIAAKWFLTEYEDMWKQWVTDEAYEKVIKAIQE